MQGPISDDIAVVGVAYKLPQDVEDDVGFWNVLQGARNLSGRWPEERMNADAHPHLQSRNDKVSDLWSPYSVGERPRRTSAPGRPYVGWPEDCGETETGAVLTIT